MKERVSYESSGERVSCDGRAGEATVLRSRLGSAVGGCAHSLVHPRTHASDAMCEFGARARHSVARILPGRDVEYSLVLPVTVR